MNIDAGSVSVSGFAGIQTRRNGPGEPGNVVINANTVNVGSGGSILLTNAFEGPGGNLIINAKDVNVSGDGSPSPTEFEGLAAQGVVSFFFSLPIRPIRGSSPLIAETSQSTPAIASMSTA